MVERERPNQERKESDSQPHLSLIIPTKNEAGNIEPLFTRLVPSLANFRSEIIFVDDSDDNTAQQIREKTWPFPVSVISRKPHERQGGLSTAVIEGIVSARGEYIGVMDADLQHPPEVVPELLETALKNDDDVVVASRFAKGGSIEGLSNPARKLGSKGTIFLSHVIFPKLRNVSDPMSGFFLFNRRILEGDVSLNPQGFKILLELLVKTNWVNLHEVPFEFQRRVQGSSKLNTKEAIAVYSHMFTLLKDKYKKRNS